ncbi:discoidin domain-containing protein [Cellulomonas sp. PhB150]|uniref:discoidin domain-containing protein n=1 Tax=Cellulomonas sp. PhB150 TaxID=2485188 RepID=UPI000F4794EE|nr:discoidin domain-containing protein [Cellulomonas sp. PhB150]ROS31309.1 F5/8 type C domain-containing protein [Cellulomonas sp. PhB150]
MTALAPPFSRRRWRAAVASIGVLSLVGLTVGAAVLPAAADAPVLLSQGKTATASSNSAGAAAAVDGSLQSRWESVHDVDPQWLQVDLGKASTIERVKLDWERARASAYTVEVSSDGAAWTTVYTAPGAAPLLAGSANPELYEDDVTLPTPATARYVRVLGTERAIGYGYSLWEVQVYGETVTTPPVEPSGRTVEVVGGNGSWQLLVDGEPYVVKGMTWGPDAAHAEDYVADLKAMGVNTIRTWGTDASSAHLFDVAAANGIRVVAGFWLQPGGGPGSGGCPDFVDDAEGYKAAALADIEKWTTQYKDDPAVLLWDVGNESVLGLQSCYSGAKLEAQRDAYTSFVNDAAVAIHAIDPNHPVTSTDAYVGAWPYYKKNAPALDLLAVNSYGAIGDVHAAWEAGDYGKPYLITEGGPTGEWEVPDDANGVPVEPTDVQKAAGYTKAWKAVTDHPGQALGATLFHYGVEKDMGGVWLNVLTGGEKRLGYYAVAKAYGGSAADDNSSPVISSMTVPTGSVVAGSTFEVSAAASDPDGDAITYEIDLSGSYATGDKSLKKATYSGTAGTFTVTAPTTAGAWKVYVLARDGRGNVGIETRSVKVVDGAGVNVALGKAATASSSQDPAAQGVDGVMTTKWGSALDGSWNGKDDEWFQVDLGARYDVHQVKLFWEGAAFGKDYDVQVSTDGTAWTTVSQQRDKAAGTHTVDFDETTARYLRMQGIHRGSTFGYSLYELQVLSATGEPVDAGLTDPTDPTDPDPTGPVVPGIGDLVCGRDLVRDAGVTATASHGNGGDAIDSNVWSRWDSGVAETPPGSGNWVGRDGEWIQVDLGKVAPVCGLKPYWEGAYAKDYDVRTSMDGSTWTTAARVRGLGEKGPEVTRFEPVRARYVRIEAVTRGTTFGVSLWDLEIFEGRRIELPTTDLLGSRVLVLDPSMDAQDIQAIFDSVFADQEEDQFGEGRWQIFFKPGDYTLDARVGFYTAMSGAGLDPTDVDISGGDWVDAEWFDMNATQNFWRSAENLSYTPTGGTGHWATSQAAPLRRVQVNGNLQLDSGRYGWSSGGFIADSNVTGYVKSFTQQQWYARDSSVGTWAGGVWNFVYSGVTGDVSKGDGAGDPRATLPASWGAYPTPPITALEHTGAIAEKPYLYLSGDDENAAADWSVRVPALRDGTTGTTWENGTTPGTSIPLTDFFVVKQGATATQVNAALAAGKNVLFTPGVYRMDKTIQVTRPGTVVLGLGLATIIPTGGGIGMHVADADGIRVAGLLFDAAVTESPALLVVGDKDVHRDHAADPIVLSDVFLRVGGAVAGKVDAAMVVDADDTIVDHVWSWRGDHGAGIGWDANTSDYGFVVNGDDVSAYGLFVEHFQRYNVLWKGERGRTVFFQNELPYDVPDQAAWNHDGVKGWAAYKVDSSVKHHEAWGLGSYSNFTSDTEEDEITVDGGFEVPKTDGVTLHHLLVVSLGGEGIFEHVVNGVGARNESSSTVPSYVERYPDPADPDAGIEPPAAPADPRTNPETSPSGPTDPEPTQSPTPTPTPTPSQSPSPTATASPTPSPSQTAGPTPSGSAAPRPTPTDPTDPALPGDEDDVDVTLSAGRVEAGGTLTVRATGLEPGEAVEVWLHSTPVLLTQGEADADGGVEVVATVPTETPVGSHTVVVRGVGSGAEGSAVLRVVAAGDLAATGGDVGGLALAGVITLLAGLVLLVARSRRGGVAA